MNPIEPPRFQRSEAFVEDVLDFVAAAPQPVGGRRWGALLNWLPLGVVLVGLAFAVV